MWELTKAYCDVKRMFQMSSDSISFYFELLRTKSEFSNRILLIFDNKIALEQCYFGSRSAASSYIKNDNEIILFINDIEYEFITIDKIYKNSWLRGKKYKDIQFKEAYERIR